MKASPCPSSPTSPEPTPHCPQTSAAGHCLCSNTQGSVDEEQVERMIKRFPRELLQRGWEMITRDDVDIGAFLSRLDCLLLFAEHEGCLTSTDEGFEDAAATFPRGALCQ